ncbi:MAG TPA: hypothetical protein VG034_12350 [Acidimicrobiia bacterium]|nr:hypothetical protein [Acidimicrobiia bacterium]
MSGDEQEVTHGPVGGLKLVGVGGQLGLGPASFGHVPDEDQHKTALDRAGVDRREGELHPQLLAALGPGGDFDGAAAADQAGLPGAGEPCQPFPVTALEGLGTRTSIGMPTASSAV